MVAVLEDLHKDLADQGAFRLTGCVTNAFLQQSGVRLANTLMDAGCFHHAKHCMPFEIAASATYLFDTHRLDMNNHIQTISRTSRNRA
ncbi:hypothetical protein H257_12135 [Aphanomyces astaci]|uniref:Uncharacterized protein n=1 Tax=Aphanomyces astaci TaxID=112090 RepID=W4G0F4_APHAT|nr:hypothetical protein H257_12135 [Aphanomyces astaci]ETV72766.1 hypothetical protein H257_12135 [Aphanomyces astaci]|eukprot:XP_009837552.1 hypothetical protein H257_12135 [Aphanomyces astaci]